MSNMGVTNMRSLTHNRVVGWQSALVVAALLGIGCSTKTEQAAAPTGASAAGSTASAASVPLTGVVDTVTLASDAVGNYFKPSTITAHRGDVIRFMLLSGVHNVDFLADSNAGKSGLPAPSAFLQLPNQTLDVAVTFSPGTYYFQCDPHAALGMRGHLVVKE